MSDLKKLIYKAQCIGNVEPIEYMVPYPNLRALNEGKVNLNIKKIVPNSGPSISNSAISFRVSNDPDSSHLYLLKPPLTSIINKDNKGGPLLSVVFSKPIESFSDSAFQMISDSDTILASMTKVNPMEFTFLPKKGWKEKETYRLLLFSKYLLPIEGKSFPDPIKGIDVISKKKIGYGTLLGSLMAALVILNPTQLS